MKEQIQITRKNMKNIRLRVKADGTVMVSAPHFVSDAYLYAFIEEKNEWIQNQQARMQPVKYETGTDIPLFDQMYQLVVIQTEKKRASVVMNQNQIIMSIPASYDEKKREALIHRFYAKQLEPYVNGMIRRYEQLMNVDVSTVKYQHMQTRWGTCHIQKKLIRLNTRLAQFSLDVVESVVVHEMVHLLERGHNKRFYQLMDYFYPEWELCDKKLKSK